MDKEIKKYWKSFCKKHDIDESTPYSAWSFADGLEDELAELVNKGIKTATTSAYELYEDVNSLPKVGEYNIILNSKNIPICVTETKEVFILPYNEISPAYARLEGEGDCSYSYWKKTHDDFFKREYKKMGKTFYEQAPMVCEIFEKKGK